MLFESEIFLLKYLTGKQLCKKNLIVQLQNAKKKKKKFVKINKKYMIFN